MEEIELGKVFANPDVKRDGYLLKKLILRNKCAIGWWSYGRCGSTNGLLWLQNYAGYYSPDFCLEFQSEEIALERTRKILEEWDKNDKRPTWTV
ncbi:hypothetical protein [Microcoleus sp. POL10_C6]|uniref:hypothetical protein n=1 Tax=Microcoleus sp. POL10_C6 TaxID=2818852 RepID=UPI002FD51C80